MIALVSVEWCRVGSCGGISVAGIILRECLCQGERERGNREENEHILMLSRGVPDVLDVLARGQGQLPELYSSLDGVIVSSGHHDRTNQQR
jgi:hypothetical protein